MSRKQKWIILAIAALVVVALLFAAWQTALGYLILVNLAIDVIDKQLLFLFVSAAGGILGCALGKLSGGSWKKGGRAGCWLLPCLLLLFDILAISYTAWIYLYSLQ